jgi:serine protease AprX
MRILNRRLFVCALISWCGAVAPASAGPRARLSADLVDHLTAGSQAIDVIVHGDKPTVDALARRYNVVVRKYLRSGAVLRLTAGQLAAVADDQTQDHLSADIPIHSSADVTAATIGADQVWAGTDRLRPLSGAGVGVAMIDSGVDRNHNALRQRVVFTKDFTGGDGHDRYGHGTHVAAIIAGAAGQTADTTDYRGIAFGARIINLRVLDETGAGKASDVIEAIDWAIENRKTYDIRVINLSLGAPVLQPYRDDPLCEAVERAVTAGIVVVAAAGNGGLRKDGRLVYGSIMSPGNHPAVITVGALDTHGTPQRSDDTVAKYSSKGPTMFDLVLKPDLVAPGTRVVSAEAGGSYLARTYPDRHVAGTGASGYTQMSGTSMSAGVVSGAVALLLEGRPRLSPRNTKAVLQMTSSFMPKEGLARAGTGSLNIVGALSLSNSPRLSAGMIAAESTTYSGIAFLERSEGARLHSFGRTRTKSQTTIDSATIVWGSTVVGSGRMLDTIVWGSSDDTIVWGSATEDTIVWGSTDDTIVWGSSTNDTIVWGSGTDDTIVWGSTIDGDTIVWGSSVQTKRR